MLAKDDPSGENIHPVEMDVRDQASVDAAVAKAVAHGHAARRRQLRRAWCASRPSLEPNEDEMDVLWRVNVAGAARVLKAAAPHLGEGSAVVNIASLTGLIGRLTGASMYGASKAGLMAYTRYLACELAPDVRVNCLAPGYIAVPMSPAMRAVSGGEEPLIEQVPLRRLGTRRRDGRHRRVPARRTAPRTSPAPRSSPTAA